MLYYQTRELNHIALTEAEKGTDKETILIKVTKLKGIVDYISLWYIKWRIYLKLIPLFNLNERMQCVFVNLGITG